MTDNTNEVENTSTEASTEAPENTTANAPAPGAPAGPNLTIGDLRLVARVIQVSSERGAIRANEMATVGDLYNRLVEFLNAVTPKQEPAPEGTSEAPAEGEAPATETAGDTEPTTDEGSTGE